ncbi:MAG: hypothetical protein V7L31_00010 [Nostoc sp.]|uniref:hypothetical protein n=1 Tax=Nostoc sp. TaxID=1180 RepID=UPI002FEF9476
MTTTVLELLEDLKHYPGATELIIKDVDDQEFAIVDFEAEGNTVNIIIGKVVYTEEQQ